MLVAVSVVSAHIKETHERWKLEAFLREGQKQPAVYDPRFPLKEQQALTALSWRKEDYRLPPVDPTDLRPVFADTSQFGGLLYVVDLASGCEVWRSAWGNAIATPSSFCFDGDRLYCADLEGGGIYVVDLAEQPGRPLRRLSHPALNDVHYVARTRRGLLIASTGTDMVLELDLAGNTLFEWWAGDYGFTTTISGAPRLPDHHGEHRDRYYHTQFQTTHLNAARYRDPAETRLLVLLWQQGMLVEIDRTQPPGKQEPRPVLTGLSHPHTLRPLPDGGWLIADSQGERLVVLDAELRLAREIPSVDGWIQDALPLGGGQWLIADVNRFRLLVQDDAGTPLRAIPFNCDWRVYGLEMVPDHLIPVFRHPSAQIPLGAPAVTSV